MKPLLPLFLAAATLCLAGCETTIVDRHPGPRGYTRSSGYYERSDGYYRTTRPTYYRDDYGRSPYSPRYSSSRVENETRINRTVNRTNINNTVVNNRTVEYRRANSPAPRTKNVDFRAPAKKQKSKNDKRRDDA